jgi:hypothetical protein
MPAQSLARDEAGNIWEVDAQGNPVRLHQPAQGAPNVVMPAAPPKPEFVPGNPNLVYTPGQGVTPLPGVPAPSAPAPNFVPGRPGYVVDGPPGAPKAVPVAGLPDAPQIDASQRAKAIQQYNYAKQLQDTARPSRTALFKGTGRRPRGCTGLRTICRSRRTRISTPKRTSRAASSGRRSASPAGSSTRRRKPKRRSGHIIPQSSDFDSTIKQKIQSMHDLAESGQQNAIQTLGGVPDANGNVVPESPTKSNPLPPVTVPGSGDQPDLATGKTRDVIDPVLRATGRRLGVMIAHGAPDSQIIGFLQKSGVNPADTSIGEILQFRAGKPLPDGGTFKQWLRANPGQAYPIGPSFYTKQVPMSGARSLFNKVSQNGAVGPRRRALSLPATPSPGIAEHR